MPQIVFLTLFLGLTSGPGFVTLQADAAVKSVRIELGGREVANIQHPPWKADIDFGPELTPQELVAIGYDAAGHEIARASQILNLPRPSAELEISITTIRGVPAAATLVARNMTHSPASQGELSVDGKAVSLDSHMRAALPQLDWSHPHVLAGVVRFENGQIARRESVLQGGVGEALSSEMSPVLVTRTNRRDPATLEGCFSLNGSPLRAGPLEKTRALVIVVKEPDPAEVISKLIPVSGARRGTWWEERVFRLEAQLEHNASQQIMWPVADEFPGSNEPTYSLFPYSNEIPATLGGMSWILTRNYAGRLHEMLWPRRFADAVAVAALTALETGRRRAVVLLLSSKPDQSTHSPVVVRHYLEEIGVPLFVWSLDGPREDLAASWGEVQDISTRRGLSRAVDRLSDALRDQQVAWVATDRLHSLQIEASDACGLKLVSHHERPSP